MSAATTQTWTRLARWLHWGMALAILVEVPAGFTMAWTYAPPGGPNESLHITAAQLHHTLGLLLLAAVLLRLGWRFTHPAPPLPEGISRLERALAGLVQGLLYALLLLIPLTGWAALSSLADVPGFGPTQMWFFGHDGFGPGGMIPRLVSAVPYDGSDLLKYTLFGRSHVWLIWFGGALLALHVLAALRHHFVRRDNVLRRMLGLV